MRTVLGLDSFTCAVFLAWIECVLGRHAKAVVTWVLLMRKFPTLPPIYHSIEPPALRITFQTSLLTRGMFLLSSFALSIELPRRCWVCSGLSWLFQALGTSRNIRSPSKPLKVFLSVIK